MPMDFPNMQSLINTSKVWKFREPKEDENETEYRIALADCVEEYDLIESMEIRTGHGWDKFTETEKNEMTNRAAIRRVGI